MSSCIYVAGRPVGPGQPAYIVAELSANHNGSQERALALVRAAHEAGADAVKLQTYTPNTLTIDCDNEYFRIKGTLWDGKRLHELYAQAMTPWEWHPALQAEAQRLGLDFFSTPFDDTAVDFLEGLGVPAHKVASFELVDTALLRKVGATGKPVILSTGMASLGEIREAVDTLHQAGCRELALLKCTSAYPAPPEEANLRTVSHMIETFSVPVGLSDHTTGIAVPVAAVALGACIVEKHFTLDRTSGGPDAAFSLEPTEFRAMVDAVRVAEAALGAVSYELTAKQRESIVFRRSLFVIRDICAGEPLTPMNIGSIRPGHGLPPRMMDKVLGRKASVNILRGTPLALDLIE